MELYYKDLISEEASLEKLVDHLTLVVQGADEFVEAAASSLEPSEKMVIRTRLQSLKDRCCRMRDGLLATSRATGRVVHQFPYSAAGFGFGLGLAGGVLLGRNRYAKKATRFTGSP